MNTLVVRHVADSDPPAFVVVRARDVQTTDPVPVAPPQIEMLADVRWYLEQFLEYPFSPNIERAERIQGALRDWGTRAFSALLGEGKGRDYFNEATQGGLERLQLQISSDEARVLSWPWEALFDSATGTLAQTCQIARRLNTTRDPYDLSGDLPQEQVNILLVTARPYEADIGYRSISRPLVELIAKHHLPARVTVLRPPTFDRLRQHLRERPDHYHILHFDGHGAYSNDSANAGYAFAGQGRLVFEDDRGEPDAKTAEQLSTLLREHRIPAVVLNACQSAMTGEASDSPFASVAAALLQAGVRSVVAMAYSLYVSGAQEFLPAFYRRLFQAGSLAEATRAGRQQMHAQPARVCARGKYPLADWQVPVIYEQDPLDFSFAATAGNDAGGQTSDAAEALARLPAEVYDPQDPYRFIGRDGPLLKLERAMRRRPAGILIHGLGGVGKTTLARGFLRWLAETVAAALREHPLVIVWDNFEVVRGIAGTAVKATMSAADQELLKTLLERLRGGATKVLITSRDEEAWLTPQHRYKLDVGGLDGEERWEYCDAILDDLGIKADRNDKELAELMNLLGGHPLMMRVMLTRLEGRTAGDLIEALHANVEEMAGEDPSERQLFATLRFAAEAVPDELRPLLTPLAFHERYVDADYLANMAQQVDEAWKVGEVVSLFGQFATAGLLQSLGQNVYEMHPALTGYLRARHLAQVSTEDRDRWTRAFVVVMASLADALAPKELHEQRVPFHLHGANFDYALREAQRYEIVGDVSALTQSLAAYAQNTRDFGRAADLYQRLADFRRQNKDEEGEAAAYHQLGRVAEEQRDFVTAEAWYRKSLAIEEKRGDEHGAARTYHQLGRVAQEQRDFVTAEAWYRKSLAIEEKRGDEHGAALTYHQLGILAEEQRNFAAAETWYRKSLAIKEKQGNKYGAASTYHQLGLLAQEQRNFAAAETWYRKSLAIKEKLRDEHGAASTYHQLGIIAQEQRDFSAAEAWCRKALAIKEKQGNDHDAAIIYSSLGIAAALQERYEEAAQWFVRCISALLKTNDEHAAAQASRNFRRAFDAADPASREEMKQTWQAANLGELPADAT